MADIEIYTDGSCLGNPGAGGWGAILLYKEHQKKISGNNPATTNNQMELKAVIEALRVLKKPSAVIIYTDSQYVKNGLTVWIKNWKVNNWRSSTKKPVKNKDLWVELDEAVGSRKIHWEWVKGHAGNEGNEKADELANQGVTSAMRGL